MSLAGSWECCVPRQLICDRVGRPRGTPTGTEGGRGATLTGVEIETWLTRHVSSLARQPLFSTSFAHPRTSGAGDSHEVVYWC